MTRNKSAQLNIRTLASPLCRSIMRPNVFHGTNSMSCANSVLPIFIRHSRARKPVSIANQGTEIQIVDTLESPETRVSSGFAHRAHGINRTLLIGTVLS